MRHFTLRRDTPHRLDHVLGTINGTVTETDGGYLLRDPSENTVLLTTP
ncbi:hypothetical protein GMA12_11445 [Kocuria sediminis]|uniref:Uncharacterized protein n=1 Tax=Kocuria sediminis TaxID=1038857 RepID=A0A6N8GLV5_9MICC|nr:hypothetical protein [Kocuria sediminis]MUN63749.1 hypothetical protein [Kocuria sediminis]